MKKITYLFLSMLIITLNLSAQTINIPDTNFRKYLINAYEINTNKDDSIQLSEAIAYTGWITPSAYNITVDSLNGIEYFVNIQHIDIYLSRVKKLNTSYFPNLQTLNVPFNPIDSLDFSKNPKLTYVFASDNDSLKSIKLNKNIQHLELYMCRNLETIDLTVDDSLQYLDISSTKIKSFDFSKNLILNNLNISGDSLGQVDLSNNINLKTLEANSCELNKLDLTKNINLTNLTVKYNWFDSLNLTPLTKLNVLDCGYNGLSYITFPVNNSLVKLYIEGNKFYPILDIHLLTTLNTMEYSNGTAPTICVFSKAFADNHFSKPTQSSFQENCALGIEDDLINKPIKSVTYYNLMGVKVTDIKQNVVYVKKTVFFDDTYVSEKVMLVD